MKESIKLLPNPNLSIEVAKFDVQKMPSYKETPFMNIIRQKVFKKYLKAHITYGNDFSRI